MEDLLVAVAQQRDWATLIMLLDRWAGRGLATVWGSEWARFAMGAVCWALLLQGEVFRLLHPSDASKEERHPILAPLRRGASADRPQLTALVASRGEMGPLRMLLDGGWLQW